MKTEEEWVLVRDVAELKPGVVVRSPNEPPVMLLRSSAPAVCPCHGTSGWFTTCTRGRQVCFEACCADRELERLDTGQSDEEQQREGREWYVGEPARVKVDS